MLCLITGATGCLGFSLTQKLLNAGHDVIALGRNQQLGLILTQLGARFVLLDLKEKDKLKQLAQHVELVFHCAALSSPWGRYRDFYTANVVGTQHVIDATPTHARLIHVSSPSIYFDFTEQHQIKESSPLPQKSANHYVKTKRIAEFLVDKAQQEKALKVITLRPRAIFGPYDRAIIPRLLRAEKNGVLPLIGTGTNLIDITFVDNVADSLILAAQAKEQYLGNKYNITNDEPKTLAAIVNLLFQALEKQVELNYISYPLARKLAQALELIHRLPFISKEPRLTAYSAAVLALGQTLNIDAAKQDLGYQPQVNIVQGMQQFANWYQSNG